MAINGRCYDHEDCTIEAPGGELFGCQEINYEDSQEIDAIYGKGATARKYGRKNYEASGSMTLDRDQFEDFKAAMKVSVGFYDHDPFNIAISYANDGMETISDRLQDIKITKISTGHKQGEANDGQMKIDFKILSPIVWNGVPAKKG